MKIGAQLLTRREETRVQMSPNRVFPFPVLHKGDFASKSENMDKSILWHMIYGHLNN